MSLETARHKVLQGAGAMPWPLVVAEIDFAIRVKADAAWAAKAGACGDHGAARLDAQGPTAELRLAGE